MMKIRSNLFILIGLTFWPVLVFSMAANPSTDTECVPKFGRCYKAFNVAKTWLESVDFCASPNSGVPNGIPVVLRNVEEANFVNQVLLKNRTAKYWLGIFTTQDVGGWTWLTKTPMNWTRFVPSQILSSLTEPYGASHIYNGVRAWFDEGNRTKAEIVCESQTRVCNYSTMTSSFHFYDTTLKSIVEASQWCCSNKKDSGSNYSKIKISGDVSLPVLKTVQVSSRIECAYECSVDAKCTTFKFESNGNTCSLYSPYMVRGNNSTINANPTGHSYYRCH